MHWNGAYSVRSVGRCVLYTQGTTFMYLSYTYMLDCKPLSTAQLFMPLIGLLYINEMH